MPEILQMYQQPPTLHHQMHPDQQDVVNDVKSQFNWSFESDFPFPLSGVIDVSDYSVDEPTKVNPVVEQNPILKKRKLEFDVIGTNSEKQSVECDSSLVKPPKAKTNTCNGDLKRKMDEKRDYIHVRARRGEATDSHSLAERARREKIKKKMQCLQDLVPGCNKTANKAEILDEIITYVQCLQSDVEFLTMKLVASTPTSVEFNMDNSLPAEQPVQLPGWQ